MRRAATMSKRIGDVDQSRNLRVLHDLEVPALTRRKELVVAIHEHEQARLDRTRRSRETPLEARRCADVVGFDGPRSVHPVAGLDGPANLRLICCKGGMHLL